MLLACVSFHRGSFCLKPVLLLTGDGYGDYPSDIAHDCDQDDRDDTCCPAIGSFDLASRIRHQVPAPRKGGIGEEVKRGREVKSDDTVARY